MVAREHFGDMVKAVVDVKRKIMAIGGSLHADEEALLLSEGSTQEHLWGINLYPWKKEDEFIEFDSLINLRPSQENRSRGVEDLRIQEEIKNIINALVR